MGLFWLFDSKEVCQFFFRHRPSTGAQTALSPSSRFAFHRRALGGHGSYKCDTAVLKSDKSVTALVFVRETALYALTSLKSQGDEDWGRGDTVKFKNKRGGRRAMPK